MYKSRKLPVIRISISILECKIFLIYYSTNETSWLSPFSTEYRTTRNDKFCVELLDKQVLIIRHLIAADGNDTTTSLPWVKYVSDYLLSLLLYTTFWSLLQLHRTYIHKAPYRLIKRQPALDRCVHINYFNISFLSFTIFGIFSSFIEQV